MTVKFNDAFFDELSRSPGVRGLVVEAAEMIAATARSTAPVDTGDYRDGIKVTTKNQKRIVALVVGTDPATMIIESQTGNLARALRANVRRGRG